MGAGSGRVWGRRADETGELSSDVADLKAKMADNKAAQADATALREKENKVMKFEYFS